MAAKTSDWRPGPSVCRCCFAEGCYKDISTEYFWMGKREVYSEMLTETFDVTIGYAQTGGPNSNSRLICEPCIARLRDASDFKRQVQECEKVFQQHLAQPSSSSLEFELPATSEKEEIKLELVKEEAKLDEDDDFDDQLGYPDDDDDDDMDDEPLTKLASKVPKQESDEMLRSLLMDDSRKLEKRKSSTKAKASPAKKAKKKESPKPSVSKPAKVVVEKKKKDSDALGIARRNAALLVQFTTAYPFRLPEEAIVCVYCCESYDDPSAFRQHMDTDHQSFKTRTAFYHITEGYIKVDCTELRCRLCKTKFESLDLAAKHLVHEHKKRIDLDHELGLQPFVMFKHKLQCALCEYKAFSFRRLSFHTQSHFLKYTCENCGKSYSTNTSLKCHTRFSHSGGAHVCRKCKKTFDNVEDRRTHLMETPRCWPYLCHVCGERFLSRSIKQIHMADVHQAEKKTYPCRECPDVFDDRKKYNIHFKIAHTNDNYVCSWCGLKFAYKKSLEEHRVVHTKEKQFPCTVCSKAFSRKKNLNQHMWIHNEYKRFKCSVCDKVFNQRVSWTTHMKVHHPEVKVDFDLEKNDQFKSNFVF